MDINGGCSMLLHARLHMFACPKRVGDWDVPPGSGWWWLEMLRLFRLPKKCGWLSAGVALWRCKVPLTVPLTVQFFVVPSSQWLGWRALAQQQGRLGDWRTLGLSDPHLLIMAMVPRFRLMVYQLWETGAVNGWYTSPTELRLFCCQWRGAGM
jgi:hypothetical protein